MNIFHLSVFIGLAGAQYGTHESCRKVDWIDIGIYFAYSNGPIFQTLLPDTEENRKVDNVCLTYFPVMDNPDMYLGFESRVYCDGTNVVTSFMAMEISFGIHRIAAPFYTYTDHVFAFDGIETYFVYRCCNWGDDFEPFVYGKSFAYQRVPLSFIRDIYKIIESQGLPEQHFYLVPMRLPHRCVTEPVCVPAPNPLFNQLHGIAVAPEPFLEELPVNPIFPLEPLLNDLPGFPLISPEPFFNEPDLLRPALPLADPRIDGIPNLPFPVPEPLFEERPLIRPPESSLTDLLDIPLSLFGLSVSDFTSPPIPKPEPLPKDLPGFPPFAPPSLQNDLINAPLFGKSPGLGLPPPRPHLKGFAGKSLPPLHPIFNDFLGIRN